MRSKRSTGHHIMARLCTAGLLLWLSPTALAAANDAGLAENAADVAPAGHEPTLQVTLAPNHEIKVGEIAHLTLSAAVKDGDDVTLPEQDFAPLELVDKARSVGAPQNGERTFTFRLDLLAFEPGEVALDTLSLRVVTADNVVFEAQAPATTLRVASTIGNEPNAALKPDGKPVVVMEDDFTLAYVGLGILAALLIAGLTLLLQRYMAGRARPEAPPAPPRPPWEIAVEKLSELRRRKQDMVAAGQAVEFVDRVSDVVREYLGRCFGFTGLDTTTEELLEHLRIRSAPSGLQEESRNYLGRCDLVKFAKVDPDQDEVDLIFAKAQDIVQFSMPTHATLSESTNAQDEVPS